MPRQDLAQVPSGTHRDLQVWSTLSPLHPRKVYKRRICDDDRNYTPIIFTMQGDVTVGAKTPDWPADQDYYFHSVFASVGHHDSGDHPNDGTPSGDDILINCRRITADGSTDGAVLASDSRVRIQENHHKDSSNDDEDGHFTGTDLAIQKLYQHQVIYPYIVQAGSGRPGTSLVVTVMLIPVPDFVK